MGWSGYNAFMQNSGHCDKAGAGGYNETTFVQTAEARPAQTAAEQSLCITSSTCQTSLSTVPLNPSRAT